MKEESVIMKITYAKQAVKMIARLDTPTKQRIGRGISGIPLGDIKRLRGHVELYRLRIGDWRVLFSYPDAGTVLIEKISPRGEVYKGE